MHRRRVGSWFLTVLLVGALGLEPMRPGAAAAGSEQDVPNRYDVIVVGGEPEGVVAAVSAARSGLKTLLVERRDGLGGVLTYGMLNYLDLSHYQDRNINTGLFAQWHQKVGGGSVFDPEQAKEAFLSLVRAEPNLTLQLRTQAVAPLMEGRRIVGLRTASADAAGGRSEEAYQALRMIDATEDGDVAAMAGAPFFVGQEDIGIPSQMAATLMIHLEDVEWSGLYEAAERGLFGGAHVAEGVAWGFPHLRDAYKPQEPGTRLRGLNIARNRDGTVMINALQLIGVDGLNEAAKREAYERGRRETAHVVAFLRDHLPGFAKAKVRSYPAELYVRETRHIRAEYQLPLRDLWENADHWDRIGFGGYPVDMQANGVKQEDEIIADPELYAIPFRSLVPQRVEGLLVASRAAGYSSLAAGSARTVPTGMTVGEAAGVAAALSIRHGMSFREMTKSRELVGELQDLLHARGANVRPVLLAYPYQGAWFYPAVRDLLDKGVIAGGYRNELRPEEPLMERAFCELLEGVMRAEPGVQERISRLSPTMELLRRDRMAEFVLAALARTRTELPAYAELQRTPLLHEQLQRRLITNRVMERQDAYVLLSALPAMSSR